MFTVVLPYCIGSALLEIIKALPLSQLLLVVSYISSPCSASVLKSTGNSGDLISFDLLPIQFSMDGHHMSSGQATQTTCFVFTHSNMFGVFQASLKAYAASESLWLADQPSRVRHAYLCKCFPGTDAKLVHSALHMSKGCVDQAALVCTSALNTVSLSACSDASCFANNQGAFAPGCPACNQGACALHCPCKFLCSPKVLLSARRHACCVATSLQSICTLGCSGACTAAQICLLLACAMYNPYCDVQCLLPYKRPDPCIYQAALVRKCFRVYCSHPVIVSAALQHIQRHVDHAAQYVQMYCCQLVM